MTIYFLNIVVQSKLARDREVCLLVMVIRTEMIGKTRDYTFLIWSQMDRKLYISDTESCNNESYCKSMYMGQEICIKEDI